MSHSTFNKIKPNSFTLIELVIVIAIMAILATVVVLTINPGEQMKSARDSRRAEELASINKAISLYIADGGSSLGSANTVYVSIADSSATCANLGLPTLPAGWSYACSTSTNLQKTDSTGWIPINFSSITFTTPLSVLPVDPVNATSTGNYYTYITGGSWELATSMESAKYKLGGGNDKTSTDGGQYTGLYELGSNLTLLPLDYGDTSLVGYWKFDEGSGTTAYDASGHGNNGTLTNGPTYTAGKVGGYALSFNGVNNYIDINKSTIYANHSEIFWIYLLSYKDNGGIIDLPGGNTSNSIYFAYTGAEFCELADTWTCMNAGFNIGLNAWHFVVRTYDGTNYKYYFDGQFIKNNTKSTGSARINRLGMQTINNSYINGYLDDTRIYNRALSAAEIQALYTATNK